MKNNYKDFLKLKNKSIIIIGGSGLIGSDISLAFSSNGSKVLILDIVKPKRNILNKKKIFYEYFDLSNLKLIDTNLSKIINKFGYPDIFINCSYPTTSDWSNLNIENIRLSSLQKNVDIHLNSFMWSSLFFAKLMKKNKIEGSIINLSSIYGVIAQDPELYLKSNINLNMIYGSIKSGISHFTKQLASSYGKYNIRANSIAAGGLYGPIAGSNKKQDNNFLKKYAISTPLKRLGYSYEVANLALFLSSNASSYITGQTILIDGGKSII